MAIEPLFEADLLQQIVDVEGQRLLDHPVDLDRPRPQFQRLRLAPDRFVGAELVEIVVGRRIFLVGYRPVEDVALVALGRVERG